MNILIIEDDVLIAEGLAVCVKQGGNHVIGIAHNGSDGLYLALNENVDLILTDIHLPDISGLSLMKEIESHVKIPFVVLTAYGEEVIQQTDDYPMMFGFLSKPVDALELNTVIELAMNRFKRWNETVSTLNKTRQILEERKIIERAKGALMDNFNMKEGEAMKMLQKRSKDSNRKMIDVAKDIVNLFGNSKEK